MRKNRLHLKKHAVEDLSQIDFENPEYYLNRELSWLAFNKRVLNEAETKTNPLFERLKFIAIFHSNLDEFFMVRLANLLKLMEQNDSPTQKSLLQEEDAEEMFDEVSLEIRSQIRRANSCFNELLPLLSDWNISIVGTEDLSAAETRRLDEYFEEQVFPVLTPLAVDPAHPFPYLTNLSLYLAFDFEQPKSFGDKPLVGILEIPPALSRFVQVSQKGKKKHFVLLEDIIKKHSEKLFTWPKPKNSYLFRVTRNLDYQLLEAEVKDLIQSIEFELKDRAQKSAVRLEVEDTFPRHIRAMLQQALELDSSDVYDMAGLIGLRDVQLLLKQEVDPAIKDPAFVSRIHPRFNIDRDVFDVIRERDVILHHPYDSFTSVLEFLRSAAEDPNVLAVKQTLYRTGADSPVVESLVRAAENGKQVTALIELKARFEEKSNIDWARRLERAGVHVVFGFVGLKTHAKTTLVVRRESSKLVRYVHLSTGNYNPTTAKFYTDLSLLTCDNEIGADVASIFNLLTGFHATSGEDNIANLEHLPELNKIKVAPFNLREHFLQLIENEIKKNSEAYQSRIILKMNALTDPKLIQSLYKASCAGVKVDLIVRGVCTLRPGIKNISENIQVISVVDRFLEHSRVFWFSNGGEPEVWLGSADFMPRNLDRRIEMAWPIEIPAMKTKIRNLLEAFLKDNCKSHYMRSDGTYVQSFAGKNQVFRCQSKFIEQANDCAAKTNASEYMGDVAKGRGRLRKPLVARRVLL